jgi:hypothetical protein
MAMTISVDSRLVLRYELTSMLTLNAAKLALDLDPLSERHVIFDRNTGSVFYSGKNDIKVHYLAAKYAIDADIVVVMLDLDRTYNAAVVDGVKCEPINLAAVP